MTDEAHLRLLRLLAERPDASQRQLAQALGISLGKTNYCVKALLQQGWITFFKHWQEELTMATVTHEPVKQAMNRIRQLSADDEARRLAFVRERALHDEVSFLNEAKREGREEGRQVGRQEGREEGREEGRHEGMGGILRKQIAMKFGELPEWAEQHLASATDAQLEAWALQVLTANSLQEILKH